MSSPYAHLIELLEPRIAPAAVLEIGSVKTSLAEAVPGDAMKVTFTVSNTGDAKYTNKQGVHVYISTDQFLDGSDILIGRFPNVVGPLAAGASKTMTKTVTLPELTLPTPEFPEGTAYLIAALPLSGKAAASDPGFDYLFRFGAVGARQGVLLKGDQSGAPFTFGLAGSGYGHLMPSGASIDLDFTGTGGGSIAIAKSAGFLDVRNITASSPMKGVGMPEANVSGNVSFSGGLEALILHDVGTIAGHRTITIGGGRPAQVKLHRVTDMGLSATGGLTSLSLTDWTDAGGITDTITTPFIGKLLATGDAAAGVPGDFGAGLSLNGSSGKGNLALATAQIAGKITEAAWTITGPGSVHQITAHGTDDWRLSVAQGVEKIAIVGDLSGNHTDRTLTAKYFGDILIAGFTNTSFTATDADPLGVAIEQFVASSMLGTVVDAKNGRIGTMKLGEWIVGGSLAADSLGTLTTDGKNSVSGGDFEAKVTLTGILTDEDQSTLAKASIAGTLADSGAATDWSVMAGDIGAITANGVSLGFKLAGAADTVIDKIDVKDEFRGAIDCGRIENLKVGSSFIGTLTLQHPDTLYVLTKAQVGGMYSSTITAAGLIGSLRAGEIRNSNITAWGIDSVFVTGSALPARSGNIEDTKVTMDHGWTSTIHAVGSLIHFDLSTPTDGTIASLSADNWDGGSLTAGAVHKLDLSGDPGRSVRGDLKDVTIKVTDASDVSKGTFDVDGFVDHSTIKTDVAGQKFLFGGMKSSSSLTATKPIAVFEITGIKINNDRWFDASTVIAPSITSAILRNVNTAAGPAIGLTVGSIAKYVRFEHAAKVFGPESLTTTGDYDAVGGYKVHVN